MAMFCTDHEHHPVLLSIADMWQIVAAGLIEVVKLLRCLQTPPFFLSCSGTVTQLQANTSGVHPYMHHRVAHDGSELEQA